MIELPDSRTLSDGRVIPYFFWDRDISIDELRAILDDPGDPRRIYMLAHLMREARPGDVWSFVTPYDVIDAWDDIKPRLGRRRAFWTWLFEAWRTRGLLE